MGKLFLSLFFLGRLPRKTIAKDALAGLNNDDDIDNDEEEEEYPSSQRQQQRSKKK